MSRVDRAAQFRKVIEAAEKLRVERERRIAALERRLARLEREWERRPWKGIGGE